MFRKTCSIVVDFFVFRLLFAVIIRADQRMDIRSKKKGFINIFIQKKKHHYVIVYVKGNKF